jgi:hypothetical protein
MPCANPSCLSGETVLQLGVFLGGVLFVGILAMVLLTKLVGRPPGDTSQEVIRAKARAELMPLDLPTPGAGSDEARSQASNEPTPERAGPVP